MLQHLIAHAIGRTQAGQFLNMLMMILFVIALPVASVAGFSAFAWHQYAKESRYQQRYGEGWKAQYEANEEGRLSAARVKVVAALVGAVANSFLGILLYRQLFPALLHGGASPRSTRRRSHRSRSSQR